MDSENFDRVTRSVGTRLTRRAAVATLLGGTFLVGTAVAGEATDRAQRRKRRKRNQRQKERKNSALFKRGISFILDNTQGTHTITVEAGDTVHQSRCCDGRALFHIPPGETRLFDTDADGAYAWINDTYWVEFFNPYIGLPWVSSATGGMAEANARCCKAAGTVTVNENELEEGDGFGSAWGVHEYRVERHDDKPDFKFFTITLPSDL